jgi:hypothetical protein
MSYSAIDEPLVDLLLRWQVDTRERSQALTPSDHRDGVLAAPQLLARTAAIRAFRHAVMPRETVKQQCLWPAIARHLPDGRDLVRELRSHKLGVERELIRLRWVDERSVLFDAQLRLLQHHVTRYLRCEGDALPAIATGMPGDTADLVATKLTRPRVLMPLQPHPDLPAQPWVAAVIKPVVGLTDRLRDAVTTAPA